MSDTDDVFAAAAHWHNRMDEEGGSPLARAEFDAWLAADPRHLAAFRSMDQLWERMGEARVDPRILQCRQEALGATTRPRNRKFAVAAALVAMVAGATFFATHELTEFSSGEPDLVSGQHRDGGTFRTAVGERSNITLSDGSSVVLNTNSRIDVRFTNERRSVRLLSGQGWFQVAKNPNRPFVVEAGGQRVTALGTAFDIRLGGKDSVQITLAEGRVSVEPMQSPLARLIKTRPRVALLAPGESLSTSGEAPANKRKADVAKIGSWRQGQIVFDNDTLETAVAEINRYSATKIVLADPGLQQLRVSGVFKAGHSQSFIETVTGHFHIQVAEHTDDRIVLTKNE